MPPAYLKSPPVIPTIGVAYWCAGKAPFASAHLAMEVAGRSMEKGPRHIYRCRTCGHFHVGTDRRNAGAPNKAVLDDLIKRGG